MSTETSVQNLKINKLTKAQYDTITRSATEAYEITDLGTVLDGKQATLVSGTNIKTINGETLLGSGDLTIQSGGGLSYTTTCPAITPSSGVATWSVTHNLGTQAVITELYTSSGAKIEHNTTISSNNAVSISFAASSAISAGDYTVVVLASGASSDTSNLANKSLSNLTSTASPNFDGQWVNNWSQVFNATDMPASTATSINLSSYLPNDSYNYEILLNVTFYRNKYSNGQVRVEFTTDLIPSIHVIDNITPTNDRVLVNNVFTLPVGALRTITVDAINWSQKGTLVITCFAYRRIGTNS